MGERKRYETNFDGVLNGLELDDIESEFLEKALSALSVLYRDAAHRLAGRRRMEDVVRINRLERLVSDLQNELKTITGIQENR